MRYRALGGMALWVALAGGAPRRGPDFAALEALAREEMREIHAPGAQIAIVSGDRVVFSRGLGVESVETGTPVTPETLFRIGSVTKMLTATVAASMAEDGAVDLERPIRSYVPGLDGPLGGVTLHQLLSHTSGLKDDFSHYGPHDESYLAASLGRYGAREFLFRPGEAFTYSGLGYGIAGGVLEAASGQPFAELFAERILKPLGMTRSTFRPTMAMTYPFSQGHTVAADGKPVVVRPYDDTTNRWASGFLFSNANELARFAIAFLNGGRLEGRQALKPGAMAKISTPHADPVLGPGTAYGYGLVIERRRGVRILRHPGSRRGFAARLAMAPEHRFGVIVLVNRSGATLERTIERAMEMFLPLEPKPSPPPEQPLSAADIAGITGAYEKPEIHATSADRIVITLEDGKLVARSGTARWGLVKIGPSRYYGAASPPAPPAEFVLRKGPDGGSYLYWGMEAHYKLPARETAAGAPRDDGGILIAEESFAYPPGRLSGANGGMGWDGPWFTSPLARDDSRAVAPGMELPGLASAGLKARTPGNEVRTFRRIDTGRPEVRALADGGRLGKDGTTIWIAFAMALSDIEGNNSQGYASIHLNDGVGDLTRDIYGDKRAHQRVQIGDRNSAEVYYLGRVTNGAPGAASYDTKVPVERKPRLLVARFDFRAGDEYAALFIDPPPGKTPPMESAAARGPMSDFRFDTVQIGSGGSSFAGEQADFDELRIGTTFGAVVPSGRR